MTSSDTGSATCESNGWEGLDVEVAACRAGLDELSCEGEDGTRSERSIKSVWYWDGLGSTTDEGLMAGFDCDDGGGSHKDWLCLHERSSSKVSGDTDGF